MKNLSNEEIADILFSTRKSVDLDYLQPDSEKILEKQRQGYQRNELWAEYCAEAAARGMSSLAQEESRSISENCTWGQRKRFADGKVTVPFKRFLGYDRGEDGIW